MYQHNEITGDEVVPAPRHPSCFTPGTFIFLALLSIVGSIIGIQLLITVGVTPNTSIIGALVAMLIARIPFQVFRHYHNIHVQNLAQSAISSATFGAANSLLLPIAVPFVFGRTDLVIPMFFGVCVAMLLDGYMLYKMYGTNVFPAEGTWPPGVAAAEAIKAGDEGGKQARLLGAGILVGMIGSWLKIPMSAFGTAFIGNIWALAMLGVGLLLRGYSVPLFGTDISKLYIPHGIMIGAGLVALFQVINLIRKNRSQSQATSSTTINVSDAGLSASALKIGAVGYVVIAALLALGGGLYSAMSVPLLIGFIVYAAFAAFVHELIVGIAAMHSGWFPAFAVALITLVIGLLIGFPPEALAILCGFTVATGPAFADMGYDLKAGFILRRHGEDPAFELDGRRQQFFAACIAFVIAMPVVFLTYQGYFTEGLIPPVAKVYVATINAGASVDIAKSMAIWAIPGIIIQLLGGSKRQLGVLLATGLLISNAAAGWAVLAGIAIRLIFEKTAGDKVKNQLEVFAAGVIAADAIFGFFHSMFSSKIK